MQQLPLLQPKNISNGITLSINFPKILICSLLIVSFTVFSDLSDNQPVCLWQKSSVQNNLPEWMLPDQDGERGMTLHNGKLFIISRSKGTSVKIVDAKTGADNGTLAMDALIKGGTYLLNDIESDSSGNLLACNLAATPKSRNFKIYLWKSYNSKPELLLSYDNPQNFRLGDHFSLFGNLKTKADIFAAAAGTNQVIHWSVKKGKVSSPDIISLQDTPSCGSAPYFAPVSNDAYLLNANSLSPRLFGLDGKLKGAFSDQVIPTGSTIFKQAITASDTLFLFYLSRPAAKDGQSVRVVRWNGINPDKLTTADIVYTTPSLGANTNSNFVGDLAYDIQENNLIIYLLATNNGIAAYSLKLKEKPQVIPQTETIQPQIEIVDITTKSESPVSEVQSIEVNLPEIEQPKVIPQVEKQEAAEQQAPLIVQVETPETLPIQTTPELPKPVISEKSPVDQPNLKKTPPVIHFRVESAQIAGFMVFNIKGDLVYSLQQFVMPGENSFIIPLRGWKNGIYPYKIILEDRIISGKSLHIK